MYFGDFRGRILFADKPSDFAELEIPVRWSSEEKHDASDTCRNRKHDATDTSFAENYDATDTC